MNALPETDIAPVNRPLESRRFLLGNHHFEVLLLFVSGRVTQPTHGTMKVLISPNIWGFPKIGVPQNGWFILKHPIKMDDLGVSPF